MFELDLVIYDNNNLLIDLIVRVLLSMPDAYTHIYNIYNRGGDWEYGTTGEVA